MSVADYLNSSEFRIGRHTLLPPSAALTQDSQMTDLNSQSSTTTYASQKVKKEKKELTPAERKQSYFSRVADVNEFGELSGDETTQSEDRGDISSDEDALPMELEESSFVPESPYLLSDGEATEQPLIELNDATDPCVDYFSEPASLKLGTQAEVM